MKKTINEQTGIVHALTGKRAGPLKLQVAVCGWMNLFSLKADDSEKVTCTKCRAMLAYRKGQRTCGA